MKPQLSGKKKKKVIKEREFGACGPFPFVTTYKACRHSCRIVNNIVLPGKWCQMISYHMGWSLQSNQNLLSNVRKVCAGVLCTALFFKLSLVEAWGLAYTVNIKFPLKVLNYFRKIFQQCMRYNPGQKPVILKQD